MPVIVVANPKGGAGKSTIATNLAGGLAHAGHTVMLGDVDPQHSSRQWLAQRPAHLPAIQGWDLTAVPAVKPPKGTTHVVLDTPAGLNGEALQHALRVASHILVPLQPSLFDIKATHAFVSTLQAHARAAHWKVGLVAMRVRENTLSLDQLRQYLATLPYPLLGVLRDTQNYVQLAARGLTVFDAPPSRVERDLAQWEPLLQWAQGA